MPTWEALHTQDNGVGPTEQEPPHGPEILEPTERDTSDPAPFVLELSATTPFFESYGRVDVRIGAKTQTFNVRTVPHDLLLKATQVSKPKIPKVRLATGQMEEDRDSAEYMQWDQNYAYLKVILALVGVRLTDKQGRVVWVSTDDQDDTATFTQLDTSDVVVRSRWTQKLRQATRVLKEMKITIGHINAITAAIDDLSRAEQVQQEEEVEDFLEP